MGDNFKRADSIDPELVSAYFKRCFVAMDGLWFVMLEKMDSFEKALEIDTMVWEVMPKIQAKKIKELLRIGNPGTKDLVTALRFKLRAEEFVSEVQFQDSDIRITIEKCPWLALLRKSKREHLAQKISDAICTIEYRIFASEFIEGLDFHMIRRRCYGDEVCNFLLKPR